MTRTPWQVALLTALLIAGCARRELSGPPQIRPGRDECAECGMLIDDVRSSCALLVERDGRREHAIFDDIGCMLDYRRVHEVEARVVEGYVHDYASQEWCPADSARYVAASRDRLRTPMGSGLAAFASADAAEVAAGELQGRVVSPDDLQRERALRRAPGNGP